MNIFTSIIPTRGLFYILSFGLSTLLVLNALGEDIAEEDIQKQYATVTVVETKNKTSLVIISYPTDEKHVDPSQVTLKMSLADSFTFSLLTQVTMLAPSGSSTGFEVTIYELMADKASLRLKREDFKHEGFILIGPCFDSEKIYEKKSSLNHLES